MALQLERIPARNDLVETVYTVLVDAITDGSLAPGERVTQEEIADLLHVSRSPVLQAIRLLKKDGFIEDAPGRGVQVAPLDAEWVGQLYDVRGAMDILAANLAVQRGATIDEKLIEECRAISGSGDLSRIIDADIAFHHAIYQASGNAILLDSVTRHWMHLRRVMGAVHRWAHDTETIWQEHLSIARAINAGDAALAQAKTEQHINRAKSALIAQLEAQFPRSEKVAVG